MKKLLCILSALVWLLSLTAYAENQVDTNKAITLEKNQTEFTIKLPSNPTTGYSWFLKSYDAKLIKPVKQLYLAPKDQRIGEGGVEVWTFKTQKEAFQVPQLTQVTFVYAQPWNIANAKETTVNVVTH